MRLDPEALVLVVMDFNIQMESYDTWYIYLIWELFNSYVVQVIGAVVSCYGNYKFDTTLQSFSYSNNVQIGSYHPRVQMHIWVR